MYSKILICDRHRLRRDRTVRLWCWCWQEHGLVFSTYLRGPEEVEPEFEVHLSGVKGQSGGEEQQGHHGLQTTDTQPAPTALQNTHQQSQHTDPNCIRSESKPVSCKRPLREPSQNVEALRTLHVSWVMSRTYSFVFELTLV